MAVPMTYVVAMLTGGGLAALGMPLGRFAAGYPNVLMIGLGMQAIFWWLYRERPETVPFADAGPASPEDRAGVAADSDADSASLAMPRENSGSAPDVPLLERVRASAPGDILALESEDHYVRVHGAAGEDMILMRLDDAVREMGATPGCRVHRSWWVAAHGVAEAVRDGRSAVLTLTNGTRVPVARARTADARAAGLLR
ncbi:LytTR family transcriptional regulator [Pacificimonas aurantium]|nr:LytTR family transcriptional regulator [Pacificimonas aurantium]